MPKIEYNQLIQENIVPMLFLEKKNPIQQLRTIFSFAKIADIFQFFKDFQEIIIYSRETSCTLTQFQNWRTGP